MSKPGEKKESERGVMRIIAFIFFREYGFVILEINKKFRCREKQLFLITPVGGKLL